MLHTVEAPDAARAARARDFIGAGDELAPLYAAAAEDPPFAAVVAKLHGLHHVRFLTLEEIAVYCVLVQRSPMTLAARMKVQFLARFGRPVRAGGGALEAMPEMSALLHLDATRSPTRSATGARPR